MRSLVRLAREGLVFALLFSGASFATLTFSVDYLKERDVGSLPGRINGAFLALTLRL